MTDTNQKNIDATKATYQRLTTEIDAYEKKIRECENRVAELTVEVKNTIPEEINELRNEMKEEEKLLRDKKLEKQHAENDRTKNERELKAKKEELSNLHNELEDLIRNNSKRV